MTTQTITLNFNNASFVYTSSVANQITRALMEAHPNKFNQVYISDLEQIIEHLRLTKESLQKGTIHTTENCKTLGL